MLQPKKTKYRKQQKGRNRGNATRGNKVDFGEYGRTASEAVIDTLGVDAAFRSRHVGHALLAQLLGNLATLQVDSVRSEVEWNNLDILGFLDRCGFAPSQRLALSCRLA